MASNKDFVDFIVGQIEQAGNISYRKMFGEYAIYCDGKVVALICDDKLFIKPTRAGKTFIGDTEESAPYNGAKNYFLIEDKFEDHEWITNLVKLTAKEIPLPKPKNKSNKGALE